MMPIWRKTGMLLLAVGLFALPFEVSSGHAQVFEVWTETTEEDFATGLGVDTINVDIRTSPGDITLAEAIENFALSKSAEDDDGCDDADYSVATGIYFVQMQAGDYRRVRKLVLIK